MDGELYFLALDLAPLDHSASSTAAFLEFSTEAFWAAASAFWRVVSVSMGKVGNGRARWLAFALPAAFLVFSPAAFLGMSAVTEESNMRTGNP